MTADEYMNEYHRIEFDFDVIVLPVVKYMNREIGVNKLPAHLADIRNMDDAHLFISDHNSRIKELEQFRLDNLFARLPPAGRFVVQFKENK